MGRGNRENSQINGLIDRGCSIEGKLTFDGTVQINGDFRGEIFSDGTLVVGPEARITGKIKIDTIVIEGRVEGTVEAQQKVEVHRGGSLIGDLTSPALAIEEGAVFHGQSQMMTRPEQDAARSTTDYNTDTAYAEEGDDSLMM